MPAREIAYLGPEGTYSHEVALKRFGRGGVRFIPCPSVLEVCRCAAARASRLGVVPIVNSSGGTLYDTVDGLMDPRLGLKIGEEVSINVRLALLGRKGVRIDTIYSHPVPLKHCRGWLERHFPRAECVEVTSTGLAAREAAHTPHAAAVGGRKAAALYGLDLLKFPIPGLARKNVTHFFIVGRKLRPRPGAGKTSLAVFLPNRPGGLMNFLKPLADARLNLSRIISRPIEGRPGEFSFFVDVDAAIDAPAMRRALGQAEAKAITIRVLGSYPSFRTYNS